jgi:peptidyl-prolyl cis-trans isomerase D
MLKGILILVAVTFISWGGYSFIRGKRNDYAAKVNGIPIGWKEYNDTFQNTVKQYREIMGSSFSDKLIDELKLKNRILDELISKILIIQEASRLGITVTEEELRNSIQSLPNFQINGQFDPRAYERFLRINRMSAEEFEKIYRENLILNKTVNMIRLNSAKISEDEIFDTYLFENERLNLQFIKIDPNAFKSSINVNEIEIKDYFQKHQEEFRIPEHIKIQYLIFRPSDFEKNVSIKEEEIKNFYEKQKERFKTPKRIRLKEILIKVTPEDSPTKIEEKKKKAEGILEMAKKTKDFSSLAKKYSESETASKGGEIGWIEKGMLGEGIENILFSLKPGDLSGVLREKNGFYIFKIEEVINEKQKSFDEVKDQILKFLKMEKAKKEASRKAEEAFYTLFRSRDLNKFSLENNIPLKSTDFFKEGDEIPEIGRNPSIYSVAFSLKIGEISTVLSIPPNFYILKLLDKRESQIPPLDQVKEEVRKRIIELKAKEKAREASEEILKMVRSGKEIKEVAKQKGYSWGETGFFTRSTGVIPKIGPLRESMSVIASLTEKNPLPKSIIETKEGFFVVKLISIEAPDQSNFFSLKKNLETRLLNQKQEEYFQNWLNFLRSKAKIEVSKELL